MITAAQSTRLHTANKLYEARNLLIETRSAICWQEGQRYRTIEKLVAEIDELFDHLIPKQQGEKL